MKKSNFFYENLTKIHTFAKNILLDKTNIFIYTISGLLVGYFLYQYTEHLFYILGVFLSFLLLNVGLLLWYKKNKNANMSVMKFMGLNFTKDIIWAVFWMYMLKGNEILVIFLAVVFGLLSVVLYNSVLKEMKKN